MVKLVEHRNRNGGQCESNHEHSLAFINRFEQLV